MTIAENDVLHMIIAQSVQKLTLLHGRQGPWAAMLENGL